MRLSINIRSVFVMLVISNVALAMDPPVIAPSIFTVEKLVEEGYQNDTTEVNTNFISGYSLKDVDREKAQSHFFAAAQRGHIPSMFQLGLLASLEEARHWFFLANAIEFLRSGKNHNAALENLKKLGHPFDGFQKERSAIARMNKILPSLILWFEKDDFMCTSTYFFIAMSFECYLKSDRTEFYFQAAVDVSDFHNKQRDLNFNNAKRPVNFINYLIEYFLLNKIYKTGAAIFNSRERLNFAEDLLKRIRGKLLYQLYENDPKGIFGIKDRFEFLKELCLKHDEGYAASMGILLTIEKKIKWQSNDFEDSDPSSIPVTKLSNGRVILEQRGEEPRYLNSLPDLANFAIFDLGRKYLLGELTHGESDDYIEKGLEKLRALKRPDMLCDVISILIEHKKFKEAIALGEDLLKAEFDRAGWVNAHLAAAFWGRDRESITSQEQIFLHAQLAKSLGYGHILDFMREDLDKIGHNIKSRLNSELPISQPDQILEEMREPETKERSPLPDEAAPIIAPPHASVSNDNNVINVEVQPKFQPPAKKISSPAIKPERKKQRKDQNSKQTSVSNLCKLEKSKRKEVKIEFFSEAVRKDFEKLADSRNGKKLEELFMDINLKPWGTDGTGKPEVLRGGEYAGCISRRINREDRLVYKYENNAVKIFSCSGHY